MTDYKSQCMAYLEDLRQMQPGNLFDGYFKMIEKQREEIIIQVVGDFLGRTATIEDIQKCRLITEFNLEATGQMLYYKDTFLGSFEEATIIADNGLAIKKEYTFHRYNL